MTIAELLSSVKKAEAGNRRNVSEAMRIYISYRLYTIAAEAIRDVWRDTALIGEPDVYVSYGDVFATDPQLAAMPDSDVQDLFRLIESEITRRMKDKGLADSAKVMVARKSLSKDRADIMFELPRNYSALAELYAIASNA